MTRTSIPSSLHRLAQDHIDMRMALSVLEREVDAVAQYHEADSEILGGGMQYFAKFPASCHHPVEDAIYGALKVRAPAAAEKAGCVGKHERIVEQVGEFAMMTRNLFLDAPKWRVPFCATARGFITLKREHIREEEKVFFPLALDHLTPEDWTAVDRLALESYMDWTGDASSMTTSEVLGFRSERGARASGSARRR